jgi:glycosyltransferase involved in cell wall biosynthesis
METLRFLMVSSHYPPNHLGGDAVMVQYLSNELARRGHEVHVLHDPAVYSLVRKVRAANPDAIIERGPAIHTTASKSTRLGILLRLSLDWSGKAKDEVDRLSRELKIDVVHWHNTKAFMGQPFASPGRIALYTAHDYYLVCPRSNLAKPDMSFCQKPLLCQSCLLRWKKPPQFWRVGSGRVIRLAPEIKVLSPSEFMAKRLKQDGLSVHHLLRNFVPDLGARSPKGLVSIVYVGMLEIHKGPRTLLEAFARSRDLQGFKLHIIGEGSLKDELRARVEDMGLTGRVNVPGFIPRSEVQSLLQNSTAMVIPSEWPENAPLAALESLSMGVPVLGSDQGGLPEILGPDSGSVIFRAKATDELAKEIVSFWERRDDMDGERRKARIAYERRFSPDVHLDQYMRIINKGRD